MTPRMRWLGWVEIALAASLAIFLFATTELRLWAAVARAGIDALITAFALSGDDPATSSDAALAVLRSVLVVAPAIVAFAKAERRRLVWVPLVLLPLLLALALAPHGLTGWGPLTLLAAVSLLATLAQVKPWLRWTAALPIFLALHPTVTTHQRYTMAIPGAEARLVERCAENDGERPVGVDPALFSPRHYAVTPLDATRLLFTSEGAPASHWVVRDERGQLRITERSRVGGNYWHGTRGRGAIWVAHRDDVQEVRWEDGREVAREISLIDARAPWEVDVLDAVFDEPSESVWAGELASGGLIRVPVGGQRPTRFDHGLFYLQLAPGAPGEVIAISTTELAIIDTRDGRIRSRRPAALCAGGLATCSLDRSVAVADLAGRVRLFERESDSYRFVRSGSAPSPRKLAFSPDCSAIAVASADDETLVVLARDDLRELHRYRLGPGLRDVTWLDDGDLLVVDACTVTRLRPELTAAAREPAR